MLRTLLENPEFKKKFITRFSDLLNSTFKPERIASIIRDTESGIELEMPRHIERWSSPKSMIHWRESVDRLVTFFEQRPAYQWQHLQEFFELEDRYTISIDIAKKGSGTVQLNSLILGEPAKLPASITDTPLNLPWSGQYFQKMPLSLEAHPATGYKFSHWEAENLTSEQAKNPKLQLHPQNAIKLRAVMTRQ